MEDRDEIQRQARQQARIIAERLQTEHDNDVGNAIAGAEALDWLRVSLEAVANDLRILADGVREPELGVHIRDRVELTSIMLITRKGRELRATVTGEDRPWMVTHVKEDMRNEVMAFLTKRKMDRPDN